MKKSLATALVITLCLAGAVNCFADSRCESLLLTIEQSTDFLIGEVSAVKRQSRNSIWGDQGASGVAVLNVLAVLRGQAPPQIELPFQMDTTLAKGRLYHSPWPHVPVVGERLLIMLTHGVSPTPVDVVMVLNAKEQRANDIKAVVGLGNLKGDEHLSGMLRLLDGRSRTLRCLAEGLIMQERECRADGKCRLSVVETETKLAQNGPLERRLEAVQYLAHHLFQGSTDTRRSDRKIVKVLFQLCDDPNIQMRTSIVHGLSVILSTAGGRKLAATSAKGSRDKVIDQLRIDTAAGGNLGMDAAKVLKALD